MRGEHMSKTLAPIHTGLYKKIVLFENIEKIIVEQTERQMGHQILVERFGDYLPNQGLETIIDHNNIHAWLQRAINTAEKRQAALIYALMNEDTKLLEIVKAIYYEMGLETGRYFNGTSVLDIYKGLNHVLLDGMPCDRVNSIIDQSETHIQWKTENDVHKENWESQGLEVSLYHKFRTAFISGFVQSVNNDYLYQYSDQYGQLHEIKKKTAID